MLNYKQDLCLALRACKRLDCKCALTPDPIGQTADCADAMHADTFRCQRTGFARVWVQRFDQGGLGTLARARNPTARTAELGFVNTFR